MTKVRCGRCGDDHLCIPAAPTPVTMDRYIHHVHEFVAGLDATFLAGNDRLRVATIYDMYARWRVTQEQVPLRLRRFNLALMSLGWVKERIGGFYYWVTFTQPPLPPTPPTAQGLEPASPPKPAAG